MPRSGVVGNQIFDEVEQLVASGLSRTEAFAQISRESGRRAGTVAANYYRVARQRGGVTPARGRRAGGRGRARRTSSGSGSTPRAAGGRRGGRRTGGGSDIDALADRLVSDVQELARAMKAQAEEVRALRERLDRVKTLLS
jgi:hypothetical protein